MSSFALPLPKYHHIYLVLREQIAEGRFAGGLPGEVRLTHQFGVARVTVRRALERLAAEGLILRAPGRGTTVLPQAGGMSIGSAGAHRLAGVAPHTPGIAMSGFLRHIVDMSLQTSVKVIECKLMRAPGWVAQRLDLAPGARVQKAVRVRSTRQGPVSHITTHVPQACARGFGRRELARKPILALLEASGIEIGRAEQAISAKLADATLARLLDVDVGCALLAVHRLVFDTDDRPVQCLEGLYRPDRYQVQLQLSRIGAVDARVWVSQPLHEQLQ